MCGYLIALSLSNNDAVEICIITHARYLFESVEESTSKYRGTCSILVINCDVL
ncbi:hypothetical protein T05_295 [Trichinella murrelli]|uniref:Uncharacterized protein n=1 Tax=Trichinella murrelli TaxID=144512 RepID=A0A0V0SYK3_9BILA|nr:hypothetical protein T05_295 [Trichinella murrelli]